MINNISLGWRKGNVLFATFLFIAFVGTLTTSCKKKDNLLGEDVYDPANFLESGGVDTFTLIPSLRALDSVYVTGDFISSLGISNDPKFGIRDASIYTQVRLSGTNPDFGNMANITVDSFVLSLEYRLGYGYWGDQTIEVYELDQSLHKDSNYFINQDTPVKTENWVNGSGVVPFSTEHVTIVGGDTLAPQLRIHLNPAKALQIMQDRYTTPANFSSNDNFVANYLKGIHIKTNGVAPAPNSGMVASFELRDNDSRMTIFYKENGVPKTFYFVFNAECVKYNRLKFDNTGTIVEAAAADPTLAKNEFYAQAGKYRASLKIPGLLNIQENAVIHVAQLYLPIQHLSTSKWFVAETIIPMAINSAGQVHAYKTTIVKYNPLIKGYVIDLKDWAQKVVARELDTVELLFSADRDVDRATRIVFNGPESQNKFKPRLILKYTEF